MPLVALNVGWPTSPAKVLSHSAHQRFGRDMARRDPCQLWLQILDRRYWRQACCDVRPGFTNADTFSPSGPRLPKRHTGKRRQSGSRHRRRPAMAHKFL